MHEVFQKISLNRNGIKISIAILDRLLTSLLSCTREELPLTMRKQIRSPGDQPLLRPGQASHRGRAQTTKPLPRNVSRGLIRVFVQDLG